MGATTDDVFAAATTEAAAPVADAKEPVEPKSAESAPAVTDADEETTKVLDPVQKRIDELTRKRYDAERRAEQVAADRDEWRDRALRVEKPAPVVEEPAAVGKKLADFAYDEEKYQDYLFEQAEKRASKAAETVLTRKTEENARIQTVTAHKEREVEFAKKVPDYFEVAHYAPISDSTAEIVMDSDRSAELAYHLGKNPKLAIALSRLTPVQQARELGKIEAKLSDVPKPPLVSGAPPPAPKITPSNVQVDKDPKDWTDSDFAKWRKKHM